MVTLVMESVTFHDSSTLTSDQGPKVGHIIPPPLASPLPVDACFVTTMRGGSPWSMQSGSIPTSPTAFMHVMTKPLQPLALPSSPPRHHSCRLLDLTSTPCHCNRIAKKAGQWTPAMGAAQNLLLKKIGLSQGSQVAMIDFESYLNMLKDGLTEAWVGMIRDLFVIQTSTPNLPGPRDLE
jgi:hypothetical protein